MLRLSAHSAGATALAWLQRRRPARVLHLLPSAIYLVDAERRVLALVEETAGPGPFHLLLPRCAPLLPHLQVGQAAAVWPAGVQFGQVMVQLAPSAPWRPAPLRPPVINTVINYEAVWTAAAVNALPAPQAVTPGEEAVYRALPRLLEGLRRCDPTIVAQAGQQLAGLGPGLTPAGDDSLVGVMLAVWLLWPPAVAQRWCEQLAAVACPRTTTLAAEFLRAAAAGAFIQRYLQVVEDLSRPERLPISLAAALAWGDSSGRVTLSAFRAAIHALGGGHRPPDGD